jgi:glucose/arabinose dehydrogenase
MLMVVAFGTGCHHTNKIEYESLYSIGATVLGINTVVDSLDVPWEICWGPDNNIWFTEQSGSISRYDPRTGSRKRLLFLEDTYRMRTSGLLGMALHTDMKRYPYVFVAYTAQTVKDKHVSKIVRFTYAHDTLINPLLILEYAAWSGHFGARVTVAPDGKLMVATGDGAQFENAQDTLSPHGKILRFNIDGTIPNDNPIPGSPVWTYGLRNPQGLAYDSKGTLYVSDHGDATDDEVNRIIRGRNYGWPHIEGYTDKEKEVEFAGQRSGITEPMIAWTPTVAPSGIAVYESGAIPEFSNSLLLATLKGNGLRVLKLNGQGDKIVSDSVLFRQVFGRLRSVCVSPGGEVYIGTSNKDWNPNGFAGERDDRIIRISKVEAEAANRQNILPAVVKNADKDVVSRGELLYSSYCASCHKENGRGLSGVYPALYGSSLVSDTDNQSLLKLVMGGKKEMPAFDFLSDQDLAVVLSYVRKRFGPQAGAVSEQEIKTFRASR